MIAKRILGIQATIYCVIMSLGPVPSLSSATGADIQGTAVCYSKLTFSFNGPECSEDDSPSPFLQYRFEVRFTHAESETTLVVPGYFAADGNAAETSARSGTVWRCHFTPPAAGQWQYQAQLRTGHSAAIASRAELSELKQVDLPAASGAFSVGEPTELNRSFYTQGHLKYVGRRYLQFARTKKFFLKNGVDSPETLLGYHDFDGTYVDREQHPVPAPHRPINLPSLDDGLHRYKPHVSDWSSGDPTWQDGKGKGLIGGLNYLAGQGLNSVYFLTMNVNGDGRNVWPWTGPWNHTAFDCSKLAQWEIVFEHMQSVGLAMHVVLQETENDHMLDGGELGPLRKLYLREMVARFAHHPALVWNLGEENTQTPNQQAAMSAYIKLLDVYDHPVTVHNDHWSPNNLRDAFDPHLGKANLDATSIQDFYWNDVHAQVKHYISSSARAGKQWVVYSDEMGGAQFGLKTDADDPGHFSPRSKGLWGNLMSGGAGVEWYFGWQNNSPHSDLSAETWRTRESMWAQSSAAVDFFHRFLPFHEMKSADHLGLAYADYGFASAGKIYCLYLFSGGNTRLNLSEHKGPFEVRWFNPRTGGDLQIGSVSHIWGPGWAAIGEPPANTDAEKDWVVLIRRCEPIFAAGQNGNIFVEAEHFETQLQSDVRKWYELSKGRPLPELAGAGDPQTWVRSNLSASATASGRTFLRILPDTRQSHQDKLIHEENFSPRPGKMAVLRYRVHFPKPGRYYVWVRAFSIGTEDNGLHVGINGSWPESGQRMQWSEGKNNWRWECAQRTEEVHTGVPMQVWLDVPSAGTHSIEFSMREDGFAFDKFLLTTNREYRPASEGGDEHLLPIIEINETAGSEP